MLILAGIALNLTIGQNGIFSRAEQAANTWRNAESNEQLAMGELEDWMGGYLDRNNGNGDDEIIITPVYVKLFTDGSNDTLEFSSNPDFDDPSLTLKENYGDIGGEKYSNANENRTPWHEHLNTIKNIKILDEIKPAYTSWWFGGMTMIEKIDGIQYLNTKNTVSMNGMFAESAIQNINLDSFDTSKVTDMSYMFAVCPILNNIDISTWDTSKVTDMSNMFMYCQSLTSLDIGDWDTSEVTNMYGMFGDCSNLQSLDLSNFNTSKVTNMVALFLNCLNLTTINVGPNWTTSNANTTEMFHNCGINHVTPIS